MTEEQVRFSDLAHFTPKQQEAVGFNFKKAEVGVPPEATGKPPVEEDTVPEEKPMSAKKEKSGDAK